MSISPACNFGAWARAGRPQPVMARQKAPGDDVIAGVVGVLVRPRGARAHIHVSEQIMATLGGADPDRALACLAFMPKSELRNAANTSATRAP